MCLFLPPILDREESSHRYCPQTYDLCWILEHRRPFLALKQNHSSRVKHREGRVRTSSWSIVL